MDSTSAGKQMQQRLFGRVVSQAIGVAAELGLADHLAQGPMTCDQLASLTHAHGPTLYRLLRALASIGIFSEDEGHRFSNTTNSELLRTDADDSLRLSARMMNHPMVLRAWMEFPYCIRTGGSGFRQAFGESPFDYLIKHPEEALMFNAAMSERSAQEANAAEAYDFSGMRTLVDVGGGHGHFLAAILSRVPELHGILFDLPYSVAGASSMLESMGLSDRCQTIGGNFFDAVPSGGDAYILKRTLHDWDDAAVQTILKNIHAASEPGTALLIVESVLPAGDASHPGKLLDLQMLVVTDGGRERSQEEYAGLMKAAGFRFSKLIAVSGSYLSIVEGLRV